MIDDAENRRQRDLDLVRAVLAGSQPAWERLVSGHAPLILSVLRRYLFDDEEIHDAFVDVLEGLYNHKLSTYDGRSALSTWLVVVTRCAAIDRLRKRLGRRKLPRGLLHLGPLEREVFRLYYVDGHTFETVRHWARPGTPPLTIEELCACLERIEAGIDDQTLQGIARHLHGHSLNALSEQMLELLELHQRELAQNSQSQESELVLLRIEAEEAARAVRAALAQLPAEERRILSLRFGQGWTAKRIAEELGLRGEQRVFTLIRKGLRAMRTVLTRDHVDSAGNSRGHRQNSGRRTVY